jgi:hypothetical protein
MLSSATGADQSGGSGFGVCWVTVPNLVVFLHSFFFPRADLEVSLSVSGVQFAEFFVLNALFKTLHHFWPLLKL